MSNIRITINKNLRNSDRISKELSRELDALKEAISVREIRERIPPDTLASELYDVFQFLVEHFDSLITAVDVLISIAEFIINIRGDREKNRLKPDQITIFVDKNTYIQIPVSESEKRRFLKKVRRLEKKK